MTGYEMEMSAHGKAVMVNSREDNDLEGRDNSDELDMQRLGKQQLFQRNFRFISIVAFSIITISGWVYVPSTLTYGLYNGQVRKVHSRSTL